MDITKDTVAPPATESTQSTAHQSGSVPTEQRLRGSCDRCQEAKLKCSRNQPTCARCASHKVNCVYSLYRRVGRPRKPSQAVAQSQTQTHMQTQHASTNCANPSTTNPPRKAPEVPTMSGTISTSSSTNQSDLHKQMSANDQCNLNNQSFHFNNDRDNDDWGMGIQDIGSPTAMFLDTFDIGPEHAENLGSLNGNDIPLNPQSLMLQNLSSIPEFSFASTFNNNNDSSKGGRQVMGQDSLPSLSSGDSIGSSPGMDILMSDIRQNTNHTGSNSSSYSLMLASIPRGRGSMCQKQCIDLVSRQLGALASQQSNQSISMDTMLSMEKAVIPIHQAVGSCTACANNLLVTLLLTMLIEQTVVLFEKLSDCRHISSNEPFDSARMHDIEWSLKTNGGFDDHMGGGEITTKSALLLGKYEVDKSDKSEFLMKVIKMRLNRTARLLLDLQQRVNNSSLMDCNALASQSIAENAYRRTEVLLGMLEMWKVPLR
ncbi:hypothetical protein NHQ30_008476 [Ciborinia camelliae]|nr:hypothetical protein NHQ30_008476 [Ciborinia camelliae]